MSATDWPGRCWRALREGVIRVVATVRPTRTDADLEEELRLHLALAEEAARLRGQSAEPARSAAVRAGGLSQAMDAVRDQRRWPWLGDLARDARDGARTLRRAPTFTLVALLMLALGIGASTAVFSVVDGIVLEPLPFPHADRLVALWMTAPGAPGVADVSGDLRLSASMYFTFADENRVFEHLGLWSADSATVTGHGDPEQVRTLGVTDGTLQALAVAPALGRLLDSADERPEVAPVVMLGYGYWHRVFGGTADVLGQALLVDGTPHEIVGVLSRGFTLVDQTPDLIVPAQFDRSRVRLPPFSYQGVGRLKPGVTVAEADADLARLLPLWMRSWRAPGTLDPQVYQGWRIAPLLRPLKQDVVGHVTRVLWVLMGTVGILLLIACANVANLLLVRADARQRELAVRAALGAGRGRIVRGLLVESLLLGGVGGLLGLLVASTGLHALLAIDPPNVPRLSEIALSGRALGFAVGISLMAALAFGLLPALRSVGPHLSTMLHAGGRTASEGRERRRTRDLLVVAQVALAFVLLVCSGLMVRTFQALSAVDPGFTDAGHVQTLEVSIPRAVEPDAERVSRLEAQVVGTLAAVPGVTAVGFASALPMDGRPPDWDDVIPEGRTYRPGEVPTFRLFKAISPGYFRAVGTPLVAGRDLTWGDLEGQRPVVMISANLARQLWGSPEAAIGKRVHPDDAPWREVVGVAADTHDNGVDQPPPATVYWPSYTEDYYHAGQPRVTRDITISIRTDRAGTAGLMSDVRQAVWSVNRNLPLAAVRTLADLYRQSLARTAFALTMLTVAATIGLVLGILGLYGIVAYAVSQRTREIGIRLALGAGGGRLQVMFVRDGLLLAGVGLALGFLVAFGITRLLSSLLFGTGPLDPLTYAVVPLLLALAAALASYVPARRAARVDPVRALRAD